MKRVAVSGATGFIGEKLCRALSEKHTDLHTLGRKRPGFDAIFHTWDLQESPDAEYPHGIDTIFHLAGKAHALSETRQDEAEYFRINTEGTRRLLEASRAAGVRRFVFFSSVKAMMNVRMSRPPVSRKHRMVNPNWKRNGWSWKADLCRNRWYCV